VLETAVFSNVTVESKKREQITSVISIFDLAKNYAQVVMRVDHRVEAPNWSPDGKYLMVNSGGDLFRVALAGRPSLEPIDLGAVHGANNDHGISPDGKTIAISARGPEGGSQVYLAGADGSSPKLMTPQAPSYFHGFSPDGKYFAFVGQRNDNFDLYRMPVEGGGEERLTTSAGYDDGPDYSPDGRWIYFNSDRSGSWDIWRIPADGAGADDAKAERITNDDLEDWFPHPSPDGKCIVFLSFPKGTKGHPPNQRVLLRRLALAGGDVKPQTLMRLFGGQGTMNVNSWSPDSTRFAFVRYETPDQK
jgi:Tol biopolymer transport system component